MTTRALQRDPGHARASRRTAAFYAMPKVDAAAGRTDEQFVLGLLRATGVLCVYGSGFGMRREDGFFRVVFLASPDELDDHLQGHRGRFTREIPAAA